MRSGPPVAGIVKLAEPLFERAKMKTCVWYRATTTLGCHKCGSGGKRLEVHSVAEL